MFLRPAFKEGQDTCLPMIVCVKGHWALHTLSSLIFSVAERTIVPILWMRKLQYRKADTLVRISRLVNAAAQVLITTAEFFQLKAQNDGFGV